MRAARILPLAVVASVLVALATAQRVSAVRPRVPTPQVGQAARSQVRRDLTVQPSAPSEMGVSRQGAQIVFSRPNVEQPCSDETYPQLRGQVSGRRIEITEVTAPPGPSADGDHCQVDVSLPVTGLAAGTYEVVLYRGVARTDSHQGGGERQTVLRATLTLPEGSGVPALTTIASPPAVPAAAAAGAAGQDGREAGAEGAAACPADGANITSGSGYLTVRTRGGVTRIRYSFDAACGMRVTARTTVSKQRIEVATRNTAPKEEISEDAECPTDLNVELRGLRAGCYVLRILAPGSRDELLRASLGVPPAQLEKGAQ